MLHLASLQKTVTESISIGDSKISLSESQLVIIPYFWKTEYILVRRNKFIVHSQG